MAHSGTRRETAAFVQIAGKMEELMKTLATVIALSFATVVMGPAFAQTTAPATPTNKAECEKLAAKKWDEATKTCVNK